MTASKKKTSETNKTYKTFKNNKLNKANKSNNTVVKSPKITAANARLRQKPKYRSFRLHPTIKHPGPQIPTWFALTKKALKLLKANALPALIYTILYALIFSVFVRGIVAPLDIQKIRDQIEAYTTGVSSFSSNVTIVGFMLNAAFNASGDIAMLYQLLFILASVLALIWLFRQQQAGNKVTLKDAYYRGMYPLVPFLVVLVVIALQSIPAMIGSTLYSTVVRDRLAVTTVEQVFWFLFFILLIVLSLYLISTSLIALFIVTLPEMKPLTALKEAHALVEHRRLTVLVRVIALIAILFGTYLALVFPAVFFSAILSQVVFFILTLLIVPFSVAYLYVLYRELL